MKDSLPRLEIHDVPDGACERVHHGNKAEIHASKKAGSKPDMQEAQGRIDRSAAQEHTQITHDPPDTARFDVFCRRIFVRHQMLGTFVWLCR
ncbi:hypothetical protein AA103581_0763 [Gluconobacter wancherniae NBRC 103581]|nr:hypothetical protein AA103581_0763 [Gluconobacter wancherniae NBRC 103581]